MGKNIQQYINQQNTNNISKDQNESYHSFNDNSVQI